jgi:hypothetical protein
MAVAAETEIEIVAAQDLETPTRIEGDPTVEIESTAVGESSLHRTPITGTLRGITCAGLRTAL